MIIVVPSESPVTTPVELTVPTAGLLLVQAPPAVVFVKFVVEPRHAVGIPVMALGDDTTVTVVVT